MTTLEAALDSGVLDREVHARLIVDLDQIARGAHVPKNLIHTPLATYCSEAEVDYVRRWPTHAGAGIAGLAIVGRKAETPVPMRMMAMAGACLRNFIDAKVMTVQEVLACLKKGAMPTPTALFIPNFYVGKEQGGNLGSWQVAELLGLLMERQASQQQTIVYVEDLTDMAVHYGEMFKAHVEHHFERISA